MRLRLAETLATGLLLMAMPAFAQAPTAQSNANKGEEKAEYKEQWKDCMARMEANSKNHEKSEGQHKGEGKADGAGKATTGKPNAAPAPQGEGKKMNRHEEQMQACREQLYGGKTAGGKEGKEPDPAR